MEHWQIKLAIARMIRFRVPREAWEDTMQELAIVVCGFRFDPDKACGASEETILCRAMDNRIRMLARCNARRLALLDRLERMAQDVEDTHTPETDAGDGEVRRIVAQFTPIRQEICRHLMDGLSELQIAALTGRHYTTIHRHVARIREAFADRGLDLNEGGTQ